MARITGPGTVPLYGPRRKEDARGDLEILVCRDERVAPHPAGLVGQRGRRVEQRVEVVRAADGGRPLADHCGVARDRIAGVRRCRAVGRMIVGGRAGIAAACQREPEWGGSQGCRRAQEPPPREFRHA